MNNLILALIEQLCNIQNDTNVPVYEQRDKIKEH